MIFLYNKIYGSKNLDYIFANKSSWSFVVDGVNISTQPTRTDAIGYKQVYFTNKATNWLVDTFGANVHSPMLFYTLTGLIYALDSESKQRVLQLAKQQASKDRVLVLYDLNTDGDDNEYAEIYQAFCEFRPKENVFLYSELVASVEQQNRLKAILAESADVALSIKNTILEVEVGQSLTLDIETNAKFTIESSANDILEVDFNRGKTELEWQDPFGVVNTQINALAEGSATIKVVARNAVAQAESSVILQAVIIVPPNPLEERVDRLEVSVAELQTSNTDIKKRLDDIDKSILGLTTGQLDMNTIVQKIRKDVTAQGKQITALEAKVTQNETNIATNTGNITQNTTNIAENTKNITQNNDTLSAQITDLAKIVAELKAQQP